MVRAAWLAVPACACASTAAACAAGAGATVGASASAPSASSNELPSGAFRGEQPPRVPAVAAPAPPASSAAAGEAACPLVCVVPHRGRIARADEARLATGLAPTIEALHGCTPGSPARLTLRFDSAGKLTGFGAEADDTDDTPCLSSIRAQMPPVTLAGPVTVRCTESCPR
jgi:hypothetical protein